MYVVCEICGSPGHRAKPYDVATGKGCPVYRLNEQQTGFGSQRPAPCRAPTLALELPNKAVDGVIPRPYLVHRPR
jgi:hypothetical protein